ncbi:MotE family protein [Ruegeria sp. HKCCD8929]|uniref:MotE family protein n=1 Tax=Ruegeria sp. HKCCD8929 TaxID=2683006 RepID=UPI0014888F50|nr:hypothetical protein [Ruegeria sp. HKCCD8929]
MISLLLIGSALIRLGLEAGPALARELVEDPPKSKMAKNHEQAPGAEDLHRLLQMLRQRESDLKQREADYTDRMKALEIANKALENRLSELQQAEESLKATLALADVAAENDLTRLTDVYQNMKPKEAAALFEEMDPTFAAGFLARMQPEAAAGVMAGLSPQAAYTISVVLAGRNASVPKE